MDDLELQYCSGCECKTYHSWMYANDIGETFETDSLGDLDSVLVCEECGEIR